MRHETSALRSPRITQNTVTVLNYQCIFLFVTTSQTVPKELSERMYLPQ